MSTIETMLIFIAVTAVVGNVHALYILRKQVGNWEQIQIRSLRLVTEMNSEITQIQERIKPLIIEHIRNKAARTRYKKP